MRLLLDQGLPRDAALLLRMSGHECAHVGELGLACASDLTILEYAREHEFIVVTLDADFHAMLAAEGASSPSVIRIRIQGVNAAALAGLVQHSLATYGEEIAVGCMVTVKVRKTTCRLLRHPE